MVQLPAIESLIEEAIGLLIDNGHPLTAEHLRPRLAAILDAPTGAAKRRRILQLRELLDGGSGVRNVCFSAGERETGGVRFAWRPKRRATQRHYEELLDRIQEAAMSGALPRSA